MVLRCASRWQARIAAANTALTALGMWALQLPGLGLLSMFVFLCSFIPIAGVAISTAPIGFVALTEYGFFKVSTFFAALTAISAGVWWGAVGAQFSGFTG